MALAPEHSTTCNPRSAPSVPEEAQVLQVHPVPKGSRACVVNPVIQAPLAPPDPQDPAACLAFPARTVTMAMMAPLVRLVLWAPLVLAVFPACQVCLA